MSDEKKIELRVEGLPGVGFRIKLLIAGTIFHHDGGVDMDQKPKNISPEEHVINAGCKVAVLVSQALPHSVVVRDDVRELELRLGSISQEKSDLESRIKSLSV